MFSYIVGPRGGHNTPDGVLQEWSREGESPPLTCWQHFIWCSLFQCFYLGRFCNCWVMSPMDHHPMSTFTNTRSWKLAGEELIIHVKKPAWMYWNHYQVSECTFQFLLEWFICVGEYKLVSLKRFVVGSENNEDTSEPWFCIEIADSNSGGVWANFSLNSFLLTCAFACAQANVSLQQCLALDWVLLLPAWKWLGIKFGFAYWKLSYGWMFQSFQLQSYSPALNGKYVFASAMYFKSTCTAL